METKLHHQPDCKGHKGIYLQGDALGGLCSCVPQPEGPQPTLSQCCKKCYEKCIPQIDGTRYICTNNNCECHKPFILPSVFETQEKECICEEDNKLTQAFCEVHNNTDLLKECQACKSSIGMEYSLCGIHHDNSSLPKEDWMDNEREVFNSKWADESGFIAHEGEEICNYWLSRIQSEIEAERVKAFKEGEEKATHFYKMTKTGKLGRNDMEKSFKAGCEQGRVEERERIVKMIEGMIPNSICDNESCTARNTLRKLSANLTSNE